MTPPGHSPPGAVAPAAVRAPADPRPTRWRVRAVVPCYAREADLSLLLDDLARLDLDEGAIDLRVVVVDNSSPVPLAPLVDASPVAPIARCLRLEQNRGGSGGFNAGLAHWLRQGEPGDPGELLWLLDSDARPERRALAALVEALDADPDLAAAGSALVAPDTGRAFELGGHVSARTGEYEQPEPDGSLQPRRVDYVAACSLLVRRAAVERAGLMADLFLNGDDVEWCLRLRRFSGLGVAAVPTSRVAHPRPDRMRLGARYYAARNAFVAIDAAGLSPLARRRARLGRAAREVARALTQTMVGRDDLAALHLAGLRDALRHVSGPAPAGVIALEPQAPLSTLPAAVRDAAAGRPVAVRADAIPPAAPPLRGAARVIPAPAYPGPLAVLRRVILGPPHAVGLASGRARRGDWLLARTLITVTPDGLAVRALRGRRRALARVAVAGAGLALRLSSARSPAPVPSLPVREAGPSARPLDAVSIVIITRDRWPKLERTLAAIDADPALAGVQVLLADNGSSDDTPRLVRARFPRVEVLELGENLAIEAFNRAAARARGEHVLILDDDATPDAGALAAAVGVLDRRPDLAAVTLHPRHPATRASEWPAAERLADPRFAPLRDRWPVMGCANLIRREDWLRAGGYDASFFLYRNDADLAMRLLARGRGVHFDPALVAWHDSPPGRKSRRWFELATRNWVWLCRRHGRGPTGPIMALLGQLHAHRLAGACLGDHRAALRGARTGWLTPPPPLPGDAGPPPPGLGQGRALRDLLRLRTGL